MVLIHQESIHVKFVEEQVPCDDHTFTPQMVPTSHTEEKEELSSSDNEKEIQIEDYEVQSTLSHPWRFSRDHPLDNILGNVDEGVQTQSRLREEMNVAFTSQIEPRKVDDAFLEVEWVNTMHEELEQFERNEVWNLVPRPDHQNVIGTKWIFKNKLNEEGKIIWNRVWLVAPGYVQEELIDYKETYMPVVWLDAIRLLLSFACVNGFRLFQMDVKSAFLNGIIKEEVYVEQPPGFEADEHMDWIFRLHKALYGLKQAPRAWYEKLSSFLIAHGYDLGHVDMTLFIKSMNKEIYVDDIIFGSSTQILCDEFAELMQKEFEMSLMGNSLTF